MRIHSRTLTQTDIENAARKAGVTVVKGERHGSRSHGTAWEIALSGTGVMGGMYGNLGYPTATWDEWGMVLAALYAIDPQAVCGTVKSPTYASAEHFDWATGHRYSGPQGLTPAEAHKRHRWAFGGFSAGRSYTVRNCACGAIQRWAHQGAHIDLFI